MDATGPLAGTTLDEFAPIYRAFATMFGWPPRVVDTLEIWEIAELLGGDTTDPSTGTDMPAAAPPPALSGRALLAARVAHAKGKGPKPEATPMALNSPMLNRIAGA